MAMAENRTNIFDTTVGVCGESTWLDKKVLRRELTQDLNRESLHRRTERASEAADNFRDDLTRRAKLRNGIEKKSVEVRRKEEEVLRQKADEYRERLRKKLSTNLRLGES
jgi:hypothetical protein